MLSDGDAKTFNELSKIKPYGEGIEIEKEEWRLGTALRNHVSDCKKKGMIMGGWGRGGLKQNNIQKLTIYYNRAIHGNKTVESMKKAVLASLYHLFKLFQCLSSLVW